MKNLSDSLIGLMTDPCPDLLTGLFGIIKSGNGFVPLDPSQPNERLCFILDDCQIAILLTQDKHLAKAIEISEKSTCLQKIVCLDKITQPVPDSVVISDDENYLLEEPIGENIKPEQPVYVIYTSGTTGVPKGVPISHQNLRPLLDWSREYFKFDEQTTVLQNLNYAFDFGVFELLTTLLFGGTLHILDKEAQLEASSFVDYVNELMINTIHSTPSFFRHLASHGQKIESLKILHLGGETLTWDMINSFFAIVNDECLVYNGYGPTEATINCAIFALGNQKVWKKMSCENIPIGKPSANNRLYILDKNGQPVPIGVSGELHVGGVALTRGYINRPDLTAKKFINNPFSDDPHSRLYKTGDLARYLPDGNIEYLGRIDNQVKIRGFRLELGEIEAVLAQHPFVKENAVIVHEASETDKRLVAYLVPSQGQIIEKTALHAFLIERLPDYMIPSAFVTLETLPVTPNGKIDRRALSQLSVSHEISEKTFVAPRTPEEELLAGIWAELLGAPRVGVHNNFFELGGHSLLATQVISRLRDSFGVELSLRELFESPTIASLNEHIQVARQQSSLPPITLVNRSKPLQLSFAQQRLWFLDQLEGKSATYNIPAAVRFEGKLDQQALLLSFQALVQRHESLRTTFPTQNGAPVVQISDKPFQLDILDLRALSLLEQEPEVQRLLKEEAIRPFDLATGPLFRATLFQLGATSHILPINMHHIIADAWSLGVFVRDWRVVYEAALTGQPSPLPPLSIQYLDFAHWQRQWLTGEVLDKQLKYWKQQLACIPALLELPLDSKRPPIQRYQGASLSFSLSPELTAQLKHLSQQTGSTLFMTLWSAFAILLARYSGQSDIVIGSPIANRTHRQIESLIGFFVNTLILRLDLAENPPFKEVMLQARRVALEAYAHQEIPFEQLVEALQPERHLSHSSLFQVMFVLQNAPLPNLELAGLSLTLLELESVIAKFDLTLEFTETASGLSGKLEYNTDLFERGTIERLSGHLQTLLTGIVENPNTPIHELPLLTEAEQQQLLAWNDTATDYPQDLCLHQLFEAQVETTPEAVAVVFEDQLTYRELNTKANQLAHYLQTLGVKPEVLVGICVERSIVMIIGLLGILKACGAYVPIDPSYPPARIRYILDDSAAPLLLTQTHLKAQLSLDELEHECVVVCLDEANLAEQSIENPAISCQAEDLAYIIYTSGSTGKPKGVMVEHQALVLHCQAMLQQYSLNENDQILQLASFSFDTSLEQLLVAWLSGAGLVLVKTNLIAAQDLLAFLKTHAITVADLPPAYWQQMLEIETLTLPTLRILILGGEALLPGLAQKTREYFPALTVFNAYGPTEGVITPTCYCLPPLLPDNTTYVAIGQPRANTRIYILDAQHQPQPISIPGELCIAGRGLARGYLNRPKLTAEKFVEVELFGKTERIYKTGDLAKWRFDGNLEYLGRIDNQVKIRGFRIELGEIEAVLAQHPFVTENAVIVHEVSKTDKRLVAYIVPSQGQVIENTALRDFLKERLPDYMIPSAFVTLENLPLTPNGKIDRQALSQLSVSYQLSDKTFVAPRTADEELLAGIWTSVLNVERVGVHDNFFELGGHSLLAVSLLAQIEQQFGKQLPLAALFQGATIAELALQLNSTDTTDSWAPLVAIQPHGTKPPFFCVPGAGGNVLYYHHLARLLGEEQPFYGLQAVGLDGETAPYTRVEDMAARYLQELQTVQPQGPYLLGGHSFGAWVALEMSKQLQLKEQKVARLAIFDTTVPFNQPIGIDWDDAQWITDVAHIIGSLLDRELEVSYAEFQQLETQAQLNYLHEILEQNGWPISIKQLQAFVKIFKANCQTNYVPQAIPAIPISLFKAHDRPLMSQTSAQMEAFSQHLKQETSWGWHQYAKGPMEIHVVPGDHHTMMSQPSVQVLADKLRACLDKVQ
jgi:amino acid adenylation domain-containing protein